ncbi:hypothetical protein P9112_007302 [Eukaryota sp. TZLM1-RC]
MRLYLNIPINQLLSKEKCICSNSPQLTLRHALNCSKLITCRSSLHDAVRDTVFNMAQTARISCIKEPLLKETLSLNNFGSDDRGDVYCDWIDNSEAIVDFVSCNVANTLVHRRKLNPVTALDFKAKEKHRKYDKDIEEANADRNTQLVFIAFPFSINGRLSDEAETFLNDFQKMVQEKTMKRFDIFLWRSRIQFAIINRLPRCFNRIREALARHQADQDFVEEILCANSINTRLTGHLLSIDFSRSLNQLRASSFASLSEANPELIRADLFSSSQFGGVGFTTSSILCQASLVGGGKNCIFEFHNRFPEHIHLLTPSFSKHLYDLDVAINKIAPEIWCQCFPDSVQEIPPRNLVNLRYCVKKFQQKLKVKFEGLNYEVRLGMAKKKNPVVANFLLDVCDSCAPCLINQVPRIYGLFLDDSCFLLSMRLRSFIWPDNLPRGSICKCGKTVTPSHLLNCNRFITFRSKLHDAVRDHLYCMFKSYKIEYFFRTFAFKFG